MKKIILFPLLVLSFFGAKSQCSSIYGLIAIEDSLGNYKTSLATINRYTGGYSILDTIFSLESPVLSTSTIETDSNRYVLLGFDTSYIENQRIYTINLYTGQVLYQPISDSNLSDVHYDVKRKKIYALMSTSLSSGNYQTSLVTINPYNGSLTVLDSITGMRSVVEETSTLGIDSGTYYVMGWDSLNNQWLYALDEATGHIKYKQHDSNVYECQYDTISKSIYCLNDTGSITYGWFFNSLNPTTGAVTTITSIPGVQDLVICTSAFAQDSLEYFFVGDTSIYSLVQLFYTLHATTGSMAYWPLLGGGTLNYNGTEYDPCNASYCTNAFDEPICITTVDTATNKAEVIWGRTNSPPSTGSYNIYKDTTFGYNLIHNQALNALSEYLDTLSFPADGPESYKLSTLDSCGESALSSPATTIYLTTTSGINVYILNWTAYVGFTPTKYRIFRGPSMSTLVQIDSVPPTTLTYHDTLPPAGSIYLIEAVSPYGACVPTTHRPGHPSVSLSGSYSNGYYSGPLIVTGNKSINSFTDLKIFPNPSNGLVTLTYSSSENEDVQINIINELGQIVYSNNITAVNGTLGTTGTYTEQLNLSNLASGIYTLRVQTNGSITVRKLEIIQR